MNQPHCIYAEARARAFAIASQPGAKDAAAPFLARLNAALHPAGSADAAAGSEE